MTISNWQETPTVFECEGSRLIGIITSPPYPHETGVVIIVGGPQYRAGSHRQFALLARHLASHNIASIRFDYRGMGDSEGEVQNIESIGPDIKAATDTLLAQLPTIRQITLWGLCDAASAAAIHAYTDLRITQLILLNPWLDGIDARARLRAYYPQRMSQTTFWTKLLSFNINIISSINSLINDLKTMCSTPKNNIPPESFKVNLHILNGLKAFHHKVTIITGSKDMTGQYFCTIVGANAQWQQACNSAYFIAIKDADHTFSTQLWQDQVAHITTKAVLNLSSTAHLSPVGTISKPQKLACTLTPVTIKNLDELENSWSDLATEKGSSIFQSWLWIRTWINTLADSADLHLLKICQQDDVIGLGIFGKATQVRHGVINSRVLCLSETGQADFDRLTIEHNNLLIRSGCEKKVWQAALDKFTASSKDWDEIRISGVSNDMTISTIQQIASTHNLFVQTELTKPYFWVDLDALRNENQSYLNALSGNTRQQIKKSLRLYEKQGVVELTVAQSVEQALAYLDELRVLHQQYWQKKGQPGAFATEFSNQFHRELIICGIPTKQVQLIKVTAGEETIGILYNLVHAKIVSNYQAGLVYDDNPKLKPGLTCHALAIEMNLAAGEQSYDFLMGESQYKRSLSTRTNNMHWVSINRPSTTFTLEKIARHAKQRLSTLCRTLPTQ